jgi:hypothetical protein
MVQALSCFLSSPVKDQKSSLLLTAVPSAPCHLNKSREESRNNPSRFFAGGKIEVVRRFSGLFPDARVVCTPVPPFAALAAGF